MSNVVWQREVGFGILKLFALFQINWLFDLGQKSLGFLKCNIRIARRIVLLIYQENFLENTQYWGCCLLRSQMIAIIFINSHHNSFVSVLKVISRTMLCETRVKRHTFWSGIFTARGKVKPKNIIF